MEKLTITNILKSKFKTGLNDDIVESLPWHSYEFVLTCVVKLIISGDSPIIYYCKNNYPDALNLMIKNNMDNCNSNYDIISSACENNNGIIAETSLNKMLKIFGEYDIGLVWACKNNHFEIINVVLNYKLEIHNEYDKLLYKLCDKNFLNLLKLLFIWIKTIHKINDDIISWAYGTKNSDVLKIFIDHISKIYEKYNVLIAWAKKNKHQEAVKILTQ